MSSLTFPTSGPAASPQPSIARELEQRRLLHRAARIRRALSAMRRLADTRVDGAPAPLLHGMRDFRRELAEVEQRLRDLQAPGSTLRRSAPRRAAPGAGTALSADGASGRRA